MLLSYNMSEVDSSVALDPYEAVRENLILRKIQEHTVEKHHVLDIGCGVGHLICSLLDHQIEAEGFDCAEKMVDIGNDYVASRGYGSQRVMLGDVFQFAPARQYSSVVANGVIWYYQEKERRRFLRQVRSFLEAKGQALIIHRNAIFNLFCLNQGTVDFFGKYFLNHFQEKELAEVVEQLSQSVAGLSEGVIKHTSSALSKDYENPWEIGTLYQDSGFRVKEILYTYIHGAPPRLKMIFPREFYQELQQKYEASWQGAFLGSQFLVVAEKI